MTAQRIGMALAGAALAAVQPIAVAHAADGMADSVAVLERDVDRLESLRAVKDLQRSYAQYRQFGLWDAMATLFADRAKIEWGSSTIEGRTAIARWLTQRGGGQKGLLPGALQTELIDQPLINLSADGRTAKGRWMSLTFLGDGKGSASFEGGIYENDYVRQGKVWKIAKVHYFPMFEGPFAAGWGNVGDKDLPRLPYHFSLDETGVPIPAASGKLSKGSTSLPALAQRIAALNDEDAVRNLQHAYGYYADRRMWDDVVDLFAAESAVELGGTLRRGPGGVRAAMETMGPAQLAHGVLNERPLFDTIVKVLPGGREAESRGIELAMLADPVSKASGWEVSVFRNRFVKDQGVWKFRELRVYPLMKADHASGWGAGALPGKPYPAQPAFLGPHPVTGKAVIASGLELVAAKPLTGKLAKAKAAPASASLADARRGYSRSAAYDGTENVSAAYGFYLDDFQWQDLAGIFAEQGNKQSPFAGYYIGRERIRGAATASWGAPPELREAISYHWRTQSVINVSQDGRSTTLRTRLFQPRTGKQSARKPGDFYMGGIHGGMYPNDQAVLENGVWRLWSLTIDEHYFYQPDWKSGWGGAKEPEAGLPVRRSPLLTKYPPDVPISDLGRREEGFRGGTGTTIDWPGILPMWFHYRNPVSGRVPERYWPDCVPCELVPESSMTRHGYQLPPTGPEAQKAATARRYIRRRARWSSR